MSPSLRIYKLLKTAAIFFVAMVYALGPLQKPLSEGFHQLEHAISETSSHHTHHNSHEIAHELNLDHDHQMLSFFNNLFSEDTDSDEHPLKELKLDKHVLQDYAVKEIDFKQQAKKQFFFLEKNYGITVPCSKPPPKCFFS